MHETALMQNLLAAAEQALAGQKVSRVNVVAIAVGQLANALPEALLFAFEAMTQDGVLRGAKLEIENLPVIARCGSCGREYRADGFPIACPGCHSTDFAIVGGDEVYLKSLDCEGEFIHDQGGSQSGPEGAEPSDRG